MNPNSSSDSSDFVVIKPRTTESAGRHEEAAFSPTLTTPIISSLYWIKGVAPSSFEGCTVESRAAMIRSASKSNIGGLFDTSLGLRNNWMRCGTAWERV